ERDDAEGAGEAATVLHLHERADTVEADVRLHAPDRANRAGDRSRRLLAPPAKDDDVRREAHKRIVRQVRAATGHEDPPVRTRRPARRARGVRRRAWTRGRSRPPAAPTGPSPRSLSRTACASACETLQPRNCTENVATAPRTLTRSAPEIGGPADLGPPVDRPVVRQLRSLGGEVPGRDQRRGAQARADSLDSAAGDVGDGDG